MAPRKSKVEESEESSLSDDSLYFSDETPRKKKAKEYRVKNILTLPHTTQYSAQTLYEYMHCGDIDLDPEYQRDVVWTDAKQSKLIDSLLRNYYIAPIIFRVISGENGEEKRICIDGKQRLTSLLKFMDGLIPHIDSETGKKYWFKTPSKTALLLPTTYVKQIKQKQFTCVEYRRLDDGEERDIFQRVQMGVALTQAEKMQALSTPWANYVREMVAKHMDSEDGIKANIKFKDVRANDFSIMASMILCLDKSPQLPPTGSQAVIKWLQHPDPPEEGFKSLVEATFKTFHEIMSHPTYREAFHTGARVCAPVELQLTPLLISEYKGSLSIAGLANAIRAMREHIRKAFKDVRTNSGVVKELHSFIFNRRASEFEVEVSSPPTRRAAKKRKVAASDTSESDSGPIVTKQGLSKTIKASGSKSSSASHRPPSGGHTKQQPSISSQPLQPLLHSPTSQLPAGAPWQPAGYPSQDSYPLQQPYPSQPYLSQQPNAMYQQPYAPHSSSYEQLRAARQSMGWNSGVLNMTQDDPSRTLQFGKPHGPLGQD